MKKRRSALIQLASLTALGAAVALTLLLPQMSGLHRRPQPLELSVIIREQDSSLWTNTRMGMEQAAGELGAELRFLTLATANDGREQWELLQREIEQGADALVVAPADPAALEKSLGELDRDVPVVILESPLEGADLSVVVPNAEMGASLAQAALEDWKGGTVLLLDTAPHCTAVAQRLAAVLIDKAEEAGVPLIFFDRQPVAEDMERWDQLYYVGARAEEGGILQGQLVLKAWLSDRERLDKNGDGILQYVMLEGEPGHQDALLRTEYSIQVLSEAGVELEKLGSDTGNWKRGPAATKMGQWLEEFGDQIEAVIANNDDMALGAIDAYGQTDWELPLVVGVDATAPALQAVAEGTLYGTVLNDAEGIARAMLDLTLALSGVKDSGDTVELTGDHYVWLSYQKVTKENLADFQME